MPDTKPPRQTIIWTALPNGRDTAGRLNLSIFISPRLERGATLSPSFPDWISWPDTLRQIELNIHIGQQTIHVLPNDWIVKRLGTPSDPELWQALFAPGTRVDSFVFRDMTDRLIRSYPVRNVLNFIKQQYGKIGATGVLPKVDDLLKYGALGPIASSAPTRERLAQYGLNKLFKTSNSTTDPTKLVGAVGSYPKDRTDLDFLQAHLFHHREPIPLGQQRPALRAPQLDFHKMVSALGEYPAILRLLGLAVDLQIPFGQIAPNSFVWIEPLWHPKTETAAISPRTLLTGVNDFRPLPRDQQSEIEGPFLKMRSDLYQVVEVDVDGAAVNALAFTQNLAQTRKSQDTPYSVTLPALRTAGLALVRTGRATKQEQTFRAALDLNTKAQSPNPGDNLSLNAEDLVRGYRVDVREIDLQTSKPGLWFSLCQRQATYHFNRLNRDISVLEEGTVSTAITKKLNDPSNEIFLPESLFRWPGGSLVIPVPTRAGDKKAGGQIPLQTHFAPGPQPLPLLRFGHTYQLRVRVVDLAGNSAPSGAPSSDATVTATDQGYFARFEPVASPVIVKQHDLKVVAGESVERIVIRSDALTSPRDYQVALSKGNVPNADNYMPYGARHIAPSKVSYAFAETHSKLDGLTAAQRLATIQKFSGSFKDVEPNSIDVVPYLPDPLASGAVLVGLPGAPILPKQADDLTSGLNALKKAATMIPFYPDGQQWPYARPFILEVRGEDEEGKVLGPDYVPPPPKFLARERRLVVRLPQATIAKINLGTYISTDIAAKIEMLGMWRWIRDEISTSKVQGLSDAIQAIINLGMHWMFTPSREITLVHAVQRPLMQPTLSLQADVPTVGNAVVPTLKTPGATFATFSGTVSCEPKSTAKLDFLAEWTEFTDDPQDAAGPMRSALRTHVFEIPLNFKEPAASDKPIPIYDSRDKAVAVCQYVVKIKSHLVSFAQSWAPGTSIGKHEFGDTRHRYVRYTAKATTRFRDYLPTEIGSDETKITRTSDTFAIHIPSSARPTAPRVLYVIPTFRWSHSPANPDDNAKATEITSKRIGGGLRVYMERPWYSSGESELLAAVLWRGQLPTDDKERDRIKPYISQWGNDPTWPSSRFTVLPGPLQTAHFLNAVVPPADANATITGLLLDELTSTKVDIVPFNVGYDSDRQLWYCDIEMDPLGAYYPFVRLALARYQPYSLKEMELSRVVLTDFAQLAPTRAAKLVFRKDSNQAFKLTVSGTTDNPFVNQSGSPLEVTIETRDPKIPGDLGWQAMPKIGVIKPPVLLLPDLDNVARWSWDFTLPTPRDKAKYRIVIKELEDYLTSPKPNPAQASRIVYADIIPL